mmetsp:Transcript_35358/g.77452  ORF Transcript_35358/g.77452 Transcript_35358/m.77452 type:complete len:82 (-) Transcript_35358:1345-1590(-)
MYCTLDAYSRRHDADCPDYSLSHSLSPLVGPSFNHALYSLLPCNPILGRGGGGGGLGRFSHRRRRVGLLLGRRNSEAPRDR